MLGSIGTLGMLLDLLEEEIEPLTRHSLIEQGRQQLAVVTSMLLGGLPDVSPPTAATAQRAGSLAPAGPEPAQAPAGPEPAQAPAARP